MLPSTDKDRQIHFLSFQLYFINIGDVLAVLIISQDENRGKLKKKKNLEKKKR